MRPSILLPLISILLLLAGCGTSGGGTTVPAPTWTSIAQGDARASLGNARVTFGPGGIPFDAVLSLIEDYAELGASMAEVEDFAYDLILYLLDPRGDLPEARLGYRFDGYVDSPGTDWNTVALALGLVEDPSGDLVAASMTEIEVDVPRTCFWLRGDLPRAGRFGAAFLGGSAGVRRTFLGDGTVDFDITVDTQADSKFEADHTYILIGGNIIEDLGPVVPQTANHLSTTVNVSEYATQVEIDFVASLGSYYQDLCVTFELAAPPLEARVVDLGVEGERPTSVDREIWDRVQPSHFLVPSEFPLLLGDRDGIRYAKVGLSTALTAEFRAHAPGASYGGFYLCDSEFDEFDGVWKREPGGRRATAVASPAATAAVSFGAWGLSIANFDDGLMAFESDVVVDTGNMTDLSPFAGNPHAGHAVYADNSADALKFVKRNLSGSFVLDPTATLTNAAWPGASGAVVSAFVHASGDLLFVTDGAPGELWVLPPGATMATKVGDVGDAPRNVRAAGNVAAVGCYGTGIGFGGLSLFVRSASGTWGQAPFGLIGPRAVGIDAKQISGNRVAIAWPDYLSNQLRLTIVDDATGEILDDQAIDLPAGCLNPGHVAFLRDDRFDAVFVSCHGSDNVALIPVSYD